MARDFRLPSYLVYTREPLEAVMKIWMLIQGIALFAGSVCALMAQRFLQFRMDHPEIVFPGDPADQRERIEKIKKQGSFASLAWIALMMLGAVDVIISLGLVKNMLEAPYPNP